MNLEKFVQVGSEGTFECCRTCIKMPNTLHGTCMACLLCCVCILFTLAQSRHFLLIVQRIIMVFRGLLWFLGDYYGF